MSLYLGLDLGTSKIAAGVLDTTTGKFTHRASKTGKLAPRAGLPGHSEWDAEVFVDFSFDVARAALLAAGVRKQDKVAGIGVTGQMHGMVLVDPSLRQLSSFIGWQDKRGDAPLADGDRSLIYRMNNLIAGANAENTGCQLATGFLGATLFWLARNKQLPTGPAKATTLPDYLVARLCERLPVTDPTNAAGSGVFDVVHGVWAKEILKALELPEELLPEVRPTGKTEKIEGLARGPARRLNLAPGVPVMNALGDNQASFFGSVRDPAHDLLINIGTGSQISATVSQFVRPSGNLETRPYLGDSYLLVAAELSGGQAYALLGDLVSEVGREFFRVKDKRGDLKDHVLTGLTRLAETIPRGSDGVHCSPQFAGLRSKPDQRGSFSSISPANFTIGHMANAVIEGIGETFPPLYDEMRNAGLRERERLVGTGNGIRSNKVLQRVLSESFGGLPFVVPAHSEEAAYGAALLAAVATGEIESPEAAREFIQYQERDFGR